MTEEQLFLAALDLPDASARALYLDDHCGRDAGLREQVEALLASHFQSGEFMDVPAAEQISVEPSPSHAVTIQSVAMSPEHNPDDETLKFLAPPTRPDSLGRIGHYEVLQVLGKGGFGIVLRAFDDVLQRVVAVKVMAPHLAATSPARKRFLREARSSAQVRHENVVQVYEVGEQPLPYLVMEFIPGETLQQMLDRMGPLDVGETVRIGRQIAEGLAAAHNTDLIHRDIKPGNVLLEGGQHKVKITDFGLARAADDASMTQSGMIAGTPMYMAPEQVLGLTLDQRADLFSLGSVLYQMVAGRPPFRANTMVSVLKRVAEDAPRNIREVIPETPQWLCDIIAKLHAKNPAARYQSAREVADVLADCETQMKQDSRLRDYSRIPRSYLPSRSQTWKWAAAAILSLIVALSVTEMAGVTTLFGGRRPTVAVGPQVDPIRDAAFKPTSDGFVPLFNGKDLTGWKTHPDQLGQWEVKDGILRGSKRQSYLFTDRGDYKNFHLRVEVKINLGGDSGIVFRAPFALRRGRTPVEFGIPGCYEAELQQNRSHPWPTGSILEEAGAAPPTSLGLVLDRSLTEADEWFTYEVIAINNHFITKINGSEVANCSDPLDRHPTGHLALQVWHANTLVQFRKIEIKELPPEEPGWVQLFNGKDLTGWKTHPFAPGDWRVEDGAIVGRQGLSCLFSESPDYANFHLRVEAKINPTGDSGIFFRESFGMPDPNNPDDRSEPDGFEAQIGVRPNFLIHTGSLWAGGKPTEFERAPLLLHAPNEWFVLEVIADGNKIQTRVNGRPAVEYRDNKRASPRGHIALQTWGKNITAVQFRKIEIKELPPDNPSPAPDPQSPQYATNDWIDVLPLIDPQLDRWNNSSTGLNEWRLDGGELVSGYADDKLCKLLLPLDAAWQAFECEVEFTRRIGTRGFMLTIPTAVGECAVGINPLNYPGVSLGRRGGGAVLNEEVKLQSGQRTTMRLEVRPKNNQDHVTVWVNDVEMGAWQGDLTKIASTTNEGYPHARRISLWIFPGRNEFVFHRIRVRMLDGGTADALRPISNSTLPDIAPLACF